MLPASSTSATASQHDPDPNAPETFKGQIRVASRIVDSLSSGLYHTPAACLKELINNSYDADATEVHVFIKPDADQILIEDNGVGMSRQEFERHFQRVSESHKRDTGESLEYGRKKIGKIGIGFIAANEMCQRMEILSTKAGSNELLHVTVDFAEMRKPISERRTAGNGIVKADYVGRILDGKRDEHYTYLALTEVRERAKHIYASSTHDVEADLSRPLTLYGLKPNTIAERLRSDKLKTWSQFDAYSQTMLEVALNVPVPYHDDWIPVPEETAVPNAVARRIQQLRFCVKYDGTELRKPIVFSRGKAFVIPFQFSGENVGATGYFYAQHGTIQPRELHGLLVRIRDAAVGEYDPQFWNFPSAEASLIQRWISAEIYADDRLEDAMNIDRRTLRIAHPAYVELRTAIHQQLKSVLGLARRRLYETASAERKADRIAALYESVVELSEHELKELSPRLASEVARSWRSVPKRKRGETATSIDIPNLYQLVVEAASEVLDEDDAARLILALNRKLLP